MRALSGELYVFLGYDDRYKTVKTIERHCMYHGFHFNKIDFTDPFNFLSGEKFTSHAYSNDCLLIYGGFKQNIIAFDPKKKDISDSYLFLREPDHFTYVN